MRCSIRRSYEVGSCILPEGHTGPHIGAHSVSWVQRAGEPVVKGCEAVNDEGPCRLPEGHEGPCDFLKWPEP